MGKKRVHEVAKGLGMSSKEVIAALVELGVDVKSHMSTLDHDAIGRLRRHLGRKDAGPQKAPAAKTKDQAGKRRGARAVRLSQYGPGLVDKVPQRPPDRRLIERPMHIPIPIPKTSAEKRKESAEPKAGDKPKRATPSRAPVETAGPPRQPFAKPGARETRPATPRPQTGPPAAGPKKHVARPTGGPARGAAAPRGGRPAPGPRPKYQRPDGGRPPAGRPPQHRRPQAGRPAPGGRPAPRRPGRPILSKNIPKPPAHLEADRPDKGAGQQRFADKKKSKAHARRPWDRKARRRERPVQHRRRPKPKKRVIPPSQRKPVVISGPLTVKGLAEKTGIKAAEIIKRLMVLGTMATINQEIEADTAVLIAEDMGFTVKEKPKVDLEAQLEFESDEDLDPEKQVARPPVVTVMGHVDHGKTSLLDAVRSTKVTAGEAGGITQHIGAYQVTHDGKKISFLDTPGHEAFTAMRARGARVTDVAILVVAGDDGVKPQTVEAINHAKAAEVPIIVAINKMDKPESNAERVKQQLLEHGLVAEEWGGDAIMVPVSARTGEGLDDLLEMVLLVAEVTELKANPKRKARGTIVESCLDKGRGPVATVLVQNGTLYIGDVLVAGGVSARVRAMMDHTGDRLEEARPSTPVEVLGFSDVPVAGEPFYVTDDEKIARQIAVKRQERQRAEDMKAAGRLSLEDVFNRIQEGEVKELPMIIKGDVQGSVEALAQALEALSTDEVKVQLVHQGVGAVTESDIILASTANAIIIGFNVRPGVNARKAAERENVDVRLYQVIYDAVSDVKAAMSGLLDPEYREALLGHAEVRKVFKASKIGTIAGCYVTDGKISREASVRVLRDGRVVFTGKVDSLKRFKDDVREVAQGYECGVTLERFNDIEEGDELEFFVMEEIRRQL